MGSVQWLAAFFVPRESRWLFPDGGIRDGEWIGRAAQSPHAGPSRAREESIMCSWRFVLPALLALLGWTASTGSEAADSSCPVILPAAPAGGCTLTLTTATNCQTLNPSAAGYYEFAWSTRGTFCESPVKILIAGSPASSWQYGNNYVIYTVSTGTTYWSWMDRSIGGYIQLLPSDLARLTSDTGQYSWGLQSYYGSYSGSGTFTLRGAGSPSPSGTSDSDRIFNWAESQYSQYLRPAGTVSQSAYGYYLRYYAQTNVYVATSNGNLYVYGPQVFGPDILSLGTVASWLSKAQAAGY